MLPFTNGRFKSIRAVTTEGERVDYSTRKSSPCGKSGNYSARNNNWSNPASRYERGSEMEELLSLFFWQGVSSFFFYEARHSHSDGSKRNRTAWTRTWTAGRWTPGRVSGKRIEARSQKVAGVGVKWRRMEGNGANGVAINTENTYLVCFIDLLLETSESHVGGSWWQLGRRYPDGSGRSLSPSSRLGFVVLLLLMRFTFSFTTCKKTTEKEKQDNEKLEEKEESTSLGYNGSILQLGIYWRVAASRDRQRRHPLQSALVLNSQPMEEVARRYDTINCRIKRKPAMFHNECVLLRYSIA